MEKGRSLASWTAQHLNSERPLCIMRLGTHLLLSCN